MRFCSEKNESRLFKINVNMVQCYFSVFFSGYEGLWAVME